MLENLLTKIWRFLKKLGVRAIQPNGTTKPVDDFSWRLAKEGYLNLFCLKVKEDKSSFSRAERRVEKSECSSTPPAL